MKAASNHQDIFSLLQSLSISDLSKKDIATILFRSLIGGCIPFACIANEIINNQKM